jgi:hypothetical protein
MARSQNPLTSNSMEFLSEEDRLAGVNVVTRIERRAVANSPGEYELWYVRLDNSVSPASILVQRPLIRGVREALFVLEYDPGPRLKRETIDLTIMPNDDDSIRAGRSNETPTLRLVASATSPVQQTGGALRNGPRGRLDHRRQFIDRVGRRHPRRPRRAPALARDAVGWTQPDGIKKLQRPARRTRHPGRHRPGAPAGGGHELRSSAPSAR